MSKIIKSSQDIVLFGRQRELKLAILQAISTQRAIWNKDVGQIVGMPTEDLPRAKHMDRKLVILFKSKEHPPWRSSQGNSKSVGYSIPDCKHALTWATIKEAAKPFEWGKYRCTAILNNNRQMAVYGASEAEAERVLLSLVTLSSASIARLSITEERLVSPQRQKLTTRMYPCYATLVTEPTDVQGLPAQGRRAFKRERRRLDLYKEPSDLSPLG